MFQILFEEENFAAITLKSLFVAHPSEAELIDPFETPQPFAWLMTFYVSRQSPLKNSLKYWTNEMFEKGFTNKWFNDIVEGNRNNTLLLNRDDETSMKALSLHNVKDFFKLLALEQAMASVVFILEIIFHRIDKKYLVKQKIIALLWLLKPPKTIWK